MSDFKVGQRVWSFIQGWGTVTNTEIDETTYYPILVQYDDGDQDTFTKEGERALSERRTLFFKEIPIPADALVPPVDEIILNVGDIILFNNGQLRYVAGYSGPEKDTVACHDSVPQDLDSAFNYVISNKKYIKKVIGNIND